MGNHSSANTCEDFHARATIAGTSSCNPLFTQILDNFQKIPSNFNYSVILWNSFYSPNGLSPSHCFIPLLLGGVAYSQCLLKFVGLETFSVVFSQTESKQSTTKEVLEIYFPEMVLKTSVLSTSLTQPQQWPFSAGLPKSTRRAQLVCPDPAQRDSLWGLHPDTSPRNGKAKQKGPNTKTKFQKKVSWPSFMFIKQ